MPYFNIALLSLEMNGKTKDVEKAIIKI